MLPVFSSCSNYTDTFPETAKVQPAYVLTKRKSSDKQAMMKLLANHMRTEIDSERHSASRDFYFQAYLFRMPCQELMVSKCRSSMRVPSMNYILSACFPHELLRCLSSARIILFTGRLFYFSPAFLSLSIMALCSPHCADGLNVPFELLP